MRTTTYHEHGQVFVQVQMSLKEAIEFQRKLAKAIEERFNNDSAFVQNTFYCSGNTDHEKFMFLIDYPVKNASR